MRAATGAAGLAGASALRRPPDNAAQGLHDLKPTTIFAFATMSLVIMIIIFNAVIISCAILFIRNEGIHMSYMGQEAIIGISTISAGVFALPFSVYAKKLGCVYTATVGTACHTVGIMLLVGSWSFWSLVVGEVICGVGMGMGYVTVNQYLVEVAPKEQRGAASYCFDLAIQLGRLAAYATGLLMYEAPARMRWRMMIAVTLPFSIAALGMLGYIPETPRWLLANDREDEARAVLHSTDDSSKVEGTIRDIKEILEKERMLDQASVYELLFHPRPAAQKGLCIALVAALMQQLCGSTLFAMYIPYIAKDAGVNSRFWQLVISFVIGVLRAVMTYAGMFIIDRPGFGRRPVMLTSIAGCAVFMGALAVAMALPDSTASLSLAFMGLVGYVCFFGVGMGPVTWVLASELIPSRERSAGIAMATFMNRESGGLVLTTFLSMERWLTRTGAFSLYTAMCVVHFILGYALYPETKGISLEEIHHKLSMETQVDEGRLVRSKQHTSWYNTFAEAEIAEPLECNEHTRLLGTTPGGDSTT